MHAHKISRCCRSNYWMVWVVLLYAAGGMGLPNAAEAKLYAVLIGINQYKDPRIQNLSFAQRDASVFMEHLISSGRLPRDQIRLITGRQATKARILHALQKWLRQRVKPNDTALIFYSGHGFSHKGVSYWVPSDSFKNDISTGIPHYQVNRALRDLKAQTTLLFLDACHSGFTQRPKRPKTTKSSGKKKPKARKPKRRKKDKEKRKDEPFRASSYEHRRGFVVLASSRYNETSCESHSLRHGVFSYTLLRALHGNADVDRNGVVTLWEVWRYLQRGVPLLARTTSCSQHPVLLGTLQNQVVLSVPGRKHAVGLSSVDVTGRAMHIDKQQSVYIAGNFSRHLVFGDLHLHGKGPNSVFVVKYNRKAETQWALATKGRGFEQVTDMAVDQNGRIWLTGTFSGNVVFGKTQIQGRGIFLTQISPAGRWEWTRMLQVKGLLSSARLAVDRRGNCTLISTFSKTVAFGKRAFTTRYPSNVFVASFNYKGGLRWLQTMQGLHGQAYGSDLTLTKQGHVIASGSLYTKLQMGRKTLQQRAIWVAKLNHLGHVQWLTLATEGWSSAQPFVSSVRLVTDKQDSIYLTGTYLSPLRLGRQLLPLRGTNARFVAKLNTRGQWMWSRSFGGGQSWTGEAHLTLGAKGQIFVGGKFNGTLQCGSFLLHSQHQQGNAFLAQLTPMGSWSWASSVDALPFNMEGLSIDKYGAIHILAVHEAQRYQRPPHSLFHILSVRNKTFLWIVPSPS